MLIILGDVFINKEPYDKAYFGITIMAFIPIIGTIAALISTIAFLSGALVVKNQNQSIIKNQKEMTPLENQRLQESEKKENFGKVLMFLAAVFFVLFLVCFIPREPKTETVKLPTFGLETKSYTFQTLEYHDIIQVLSKDACRFELEFISRFKINKEKIQEIHEKYRSQELLFSGIENEIKWNFIKEARDYFGMEMLEGDFQNNVKVRIDTILRNMGIEVEHVAMKIIPEEHLKELLEAKTKAIELKAEADKYNYINKKLQ